MLMKASPRCLSVLVMCSRTGLGHSLELQTPTPTAAAAAANGPFAGGGTNKRGGAADEKPSSKRYKVWLREDTQ